MSAYDFEHLKLEDEVREHLKASTVYMVVQRPLTYFDNVVISEGVITFDIADGVQQPLHCKLQLQDTQFANIAEDARLTVGFYDPQGDLQSQPFRDVAAFQLHDKNDVFQVWWSPFKFLYEVLVCGLVAHIDGDPLNFLDFEVHYIGQAFSQRVWERLTGHEKQQKVLTLEAAIGPSRLTRPSFEIALILLEIVDVSETVMMGDPALLPVADPIAAPVDVTDEASLDRFYAEPFVKLGDKAATNELEAFLVHTFKPAYNSTLFNNYPHITNGMRAKGYSNTTIIIQDLPARLRTAEFRIEAS